MSSKLSNTDDVCEYMERSMVTLKFRGQAQKFLRKYAFDEVTTQNVIQLVVEQDEDIVLNNRDQAIFVDRIFQNSRKLFATCVYCALSLKYLKTLLENGVTDSQFPLREGDCGSLKQKRAFTRSFIPNQKLFNAPFFSDDSMLSLDDRYAIPIDFEESKANYKGRGAFGEVWTIAIHRDHRSFSCDTNDNAQFAMKVTSHEGREQNYHRAMAGLSHSHLVKCFSSFTFGAKYHMVYELANCNLEEFIAKNQIASRVPGLTASWLAKQLVGLAGALQVVHNPERTGSPADWSGQLHVPQASSARTGYIHDIKPENILVFVYHGKVHWLRLSDFSCAKVVELVATISGKRDSYKTGTQTGTPIYRAPESDSATSRPYDMWSLGCVYLELLVWFVQGYQALEAFRRSRELETRPGMSDEGFYYKHGSGTAQLRQAVVDKIRELSRQCSGSLKDIVNAIPSLLEIEPKARPTASQLLAKLRHLDPDAKLTSSGLAKRSLAASNLTAPQLPIWDSDSDFDGALRIEVTKVE